MHVARADWNAITADCDESAPVATPVVYLFLERWRLRTASGWRKLSERLGGRRPIEQISGGK